ncbi:c-type cytochrome [Candidatus Obscuribacterales bacterium]|nr:c-type cytochrome [Candidatus Obscuribacterales bacterium]
MNAVTLLKAISLVISIDVLFLCVDVPSALANNPSVLFNEKCAGCHTIGGGNLVGPDLAPTAKWSSVDLAKAVKGMEKSVGPLSTEDVDSLVEYLRKPQTANSKDSGQTADVVAPLVENAAEKSVPAAEPGSATRGSRLFSGAEALSNGGVSCIACHRADDAGGTMAPELTLISNKLSESAMVSAFEHTPYKVMKTAYQDHPVTHQEAVDLAAYFSSLKNPHDKLTEAPVSMIGFGIATCVFGMIAFGYRGRNKSARAKLQRRN